MNKNHKKILLQTRVNLVKDLEANDVLNYLYQERILSENDVELVKAEKTRKARAEVLLDTIPRKGKRAFDEFVNSLKQQNGTKHLADILLDLAQGGEDTTDSPKEVSDKAEQHGKESSIYAMNHKPHGTCLIVNNKEFLGGLSDRTGTDTDAKHLKELFSLFNFTVKLVNNASGTQMRKAVKDVADANHSSIDCVVVCLLSHGISGNIYASDGELIPLSELLEPLLMCDGKPELAAKPRLFFIQACRVVKQETATGQVTEEDKATLNSFEVTVHANQLCNSLSASESVVSSSELLIQEITAPSQANILMSYCTFPGKEAWRNLETGSWFINALVDVFKTHAEKEDVLSMLVRVNDAVSKRVSSISKAKQIPAPIVTLTKKLFFKS